MIGFEGWPMSEGLTGAFASMSLMKSPYAFKKFCNGGVAERLKAHAWKACIRETVSRVRIPLPPPAFLKTRSLALRDQH
jgi:hypothetical protein